MRLIDILSTASSNMLRSKVRSVLTMIAVFVGALTITLTVGISSGISTYIDDQLGNLGAEDVLIIQGQTDIGRSDGGPKKYDPNRTLASSAQVGFPQVALTQKDVEVIKSQPGIVSAEPNLSAAVDYIEGANNEKYQINVVEFIEGTNLGLAAGHSFADGSNQSEVILPISYVSALGYDSNQGAVGQVVSFGVTDATGQQHSVEAAIVGVQEQTLISAGGANVNRVLMEKLSALQGQGLPESFRDKHQVVVARLAPDISDQALVTVKENLKEKGYSAMTVKDQIGIFKQVIDAISAVLIFFGAIALLAASFGIINTLFMAVHERTKEIGLMKAVGMRKNRIFMLFSVEAILLGFWGSLIGVLAAMGLGRVINRAASNSFLKELHGFELTSFPLHSTALIVLLVMAIAFLAGTLPARRAAKQDPIEALRYE